MISCRFYLSSRGVKNNACCISYNGNRCNLSLHHRIQNQLKRSWVKVNSIELFLFFFFFSLSSFHPEQNVRDISWICLINLWQRGCWSQCNMIDDHTCILVHFRITCPIVSNFWISFLDFINKISYFVLIFEYRFFVE